MTQGHFEVASAPSSSTSSSPPLALQVLEGGRQPLCGLGPRLAFSIQCKYCKRPSPAPEERVWGKSVTETVWLSHASFRRTRPICCPGFLCGEPAKEGGLWPPDRMFELFRVSWAGRNAGIRGNVGCGPWLCPWEEGSSGRCLGAQTMCV